jgi:hypothetical protein
MDPIQKPGALLALHDVTAELFDTLKAWFDVGDEVTISLADIDSAIEELGEPALIAAMAMRKLQALRLLAQPGVRTTTDVIVTIVQDLDRAMLQAPAMWLKRTAAETDWDAEFAALVDESAGRGSGWGSAAVTGRRVHRISPTATSPPPRMGSSPTPRSDASASSTRGSTGPCVLWSKSATGRSGCSSRDAWRCGPGRALGTRRAGVGRSSCERGAHRWRR